METKKCLKCGEEKPLDRFYFRKDRGSHHPRCKDCLALERREYRKSQPEQRKYRPYDPVEQKKRRERKKAFMAEDKLSKGCAVCGFNSHESALVYHHRNPELKSFEIGSYGYSKSMKKLQEEIDKCDVLCANCHQMFHAGALAY